MDYKRLRLMRVAARVQRMHTMPTIYRQSVGEHTFGALAILFTIVPLPSMQLVRALLHHDAPEALMGDIPSPAISAISGYRDVLDAAEHRISREYNLGEELTDAEINILKFCDTMELVMYATEEVDNGNRNMAVVMRRALKSIQTRGLCDVTPAALSLYQLITLRAEKTYPADLGNDTLNGYPED